MTIASQIGKINANLETSTRLKEFGAFTRYLLEAKGRPGNASRLAEENHATPRVINILKSAISVGTTTDANWASSLAEYNLIAQAFLGSLAPFSAFDTALPDFVRVPLHSRVDLISTTASATVVGQGEPKPFTQLALATNQLEERKAVAIVAVTNELIKLATPIALDLITNELRKAVAVETDATFLDILSNTSDVASITSGEMSASQFAADLAEALDAISYGADAKLYLVLPVESAKVVAFLRDANGSLYPGLTINGGTIAGIRVIVSSAATNAILFDASQIAANSDTIVLDATEHASYQADDAPTSAAANVINLWQENKRAVKAERFFGAEVLRPEAVAVIEGVTA